MIPNKLIKRVLATNFYSSRYFTTISGISHEQPQTWPAPKPLEDSAQQIRANEEPRRTDRIKDSVQKVEYEASNIIGEVKEGFKEAKKSASEKVDELSKKAKEGYKEAKKSASDKVDEISKQAKEGYKEAKKSVSEKVDELSKQAKAKGEQIGKAVYDMEDKRDGVTATSERANTMSEGVKTTMESEKGKKMQMGDPTSDMPKIVEDHADTTRQHRKPSENLPDKAKEEYERDSKPVEDPKGAWHKAKDGVSNAASYIKGAIFPGEEPKKMN